jgi:hypothetical protein
VFGSDKFHRGNSPEGIKNKVRGEKQPPGTNPQMKSAIFSAACEAVPFPKPIMR